METTILNVGGMSCEHCVKSVKNTVGALPGVLTVAVDLKTKTVTVEHDPLAVPVDKIKAEIEDLGYDVA